MCLWGKQLRGPTLSLSIQASVRTSEEWPERVLESLNGAGGAIALRDGCTVGKVVDLRFAVDQFGEYVSAESFNLVVISADQMRAPDLGHHQKRSMEARGKGN